MVFVVNSFEWGPLIEPKRESVTLGKRYKQPTSSIDDRKVPLGATQTLISMSSTGKKIENAEHFIDFSWFCFRRPFCRNARDMVVNDRNVFNFGIHVYSTCPRKANNKKNERQMRMRTNGREKSSPTEVELEKKLRGNRTKTIFTSRPHELFDSRVLVFGEINELFTSSSVMVVTDFS